MQGKEKGGGEGCPNSEKNYPRSEQREIRYCQKHRPQEPQLQAKGNNQNMTIPKSRKPFLNAISNHHFFVLLLFEFKVLPKFQTKQIFFNSRMWRCMTLLEIWGAMEQYFFLKGKASKGCDIASQVFLEV